MQLTDIPRRLFDEFGLHKRRVESKGGRAETEEGAILVLEEYSDAERQIYTLQLWSTWMKYEEGHSDGRLLQLTAREGYAFPPLDLAGKGQWPLLHGGFGGLDLIGFLARFMTRLRELIQEYEQQ